MTALEEIKKAEHKRIWLEPAGAPDRCWCQDNQWGDEGVEYVLASALESLQRENTALKIDASNHAADAETVRRERETERHRAEAAEAEVKRLITVVQTAHVAMTLAFHMPGVAEEYDFSDAIAATFQALASTGCEHHAE